MSFYTRLATTAVRLLTKYGVERTFTHTEPGTYDPDTNATGDTSSTYDAKVVKWDYSTFEKQSDAIQQGDIRLIGESASYYVDDTVTIDSIVYRIDSVEPIKPADTEVAVIIQLKR